MEGKTWKVETGTHSKAQLLLALSEYKVNLNAYAAMLFMSQAFEVSTERQTVELMGVSVHELGFTEGTLFADILKAAKHQGLAPCAFELAAYLRLTYRTQVKGTILTVASIPVCSDEIHPTGFYLRADDAGP
ncbi:hypothetical protein [Photobacterium sp. 1_MG-2023]|uniref:hypothetical protein n=1 Tax=Photobacterium sp. 1_MG-2023 TaxID=3062646 RepID=UPI0026E2BF5B|nr:hypothetical protein [Photobacterium sp. 1_MG-2023]MDO6707386.1 hypothetical protein [Photobacterium sp. 1_MG-2023]